MRISILKTTIIFCCGILWANETFAQEILEEKFSLHLDRVTLKQALKKIESLTQVKFVYSSNYLKLDERITIDASKNTLREILDELLVKRAIDYAPQGETPYIVLFEHRATATPLAEESSSAKDGVAQQEEDAPVVPLLVSGFIRESATGQPVVGANIIVKSTLNGTVSDANGYYVLDARMNDVLVFSFTGYKTQRIKLIGQTSIDVVLEEDIEALEEVEINAGYWSVSEKEKTGSISKVTSKTIAQQPVSNTLQAMIGRMPGVSVVQPSGLAGTAFEVRIRGQNSTRYDGNYPLYIVDGVPLHSNPTPVFGIMMSTTGLDPFSTINPEDVESIEVLKDADATAIYGSRGSNGVVLITTKRGKAGKTNLNVNVNAGIGELPKKIETLNTQQYLMMRKEAYANDGITPAEEDAPDLLRWDTTRYTDWQEKLLGGTQHITQAKVDISGGNGNTFFRLGGGHSKFTYIFPGDSKYRKTTGQFRLTHVAPNQKFTANLVLNYGVEKSVLFDDFVMVQALRLAPNAPELVNEEGEPSWKNSTFENPYANFLRTDETGTENFIANSLLAYQFLPGLDLKANVGYVNVRTEEVVITPMKSWSPVDRDLRQGESRFLDTKTRSWVIEPQLEYRKDIGQGELTVLVGSTWQDRAYVYDALSGKGYTNDDLLGSKSAAARLYVVYAEDNRYRYNAVFGRVGFNWANKYIFNFTARRDGSSRFGSDRQFANFGAMGAAWIFSRENFLKDHSILSFGKVRASYGTAGSDNIGDYQYLDTYSATSFPFQGMASITPTALANPDYAWEVTKKFECALELAFFNDGLQFTGSWYRNTTSNQLLDYPVPAVTGFASVRQNSPASVRNYGLEFELASVNLRNRHFFWNTSFNLTIPRNKLVSYPMLGQSSDANRLKVGESVQIGKRYLYEGVDPETGLYTYKDVDQSGSLSSADRLAVIDRGRRYYGGLQNTFSYKGWELDLFIQFVKQKGYDYSYSLFGSPPGTLSNQPALVMDRWQKAGDDTDSQRFTSSFGTDAANLYEFAKYSGENTITDASYIRLQSVSLSWSLPAKVARRMAIEGGKVYAQGQNLWTLTDYIGFDPAAPGVYDMPPLRSYVLGIQLTF